MGFRKVQKPVLPRARARRCPVEIGGDLFYHRGFSSRTKKVIVKSASYFSVFGYLVDHSVVDYYQTKMVFGIHSVVAGYEMMAGVVEFESESESEYWKK